MRIGKEGGPECIGEKVREWDRFEKPDRFSEQHRDNRHRRRNGCQGGKKEPANAGHATNIMEASSVLFILPSFVLGQSN